MTENEAIKVFKELLDVPCEMLVKYDSVATEEQKKALVKIRVAEDMAIQALEEIQEYRAIGTVKGYEKAIQSSMEYYNLMKEYKAKVDELEAIGTIEEFKVLKEKSVAKKPHSISIANDIGNSMIECPICHARSDYDIKSIKKGHCWRCGQKLDWSE